MGSTSSSTKSSIDSDKKAHEVNPTVFKFPDKTKLSHAIAEALVSSSKQAVKQRGAFTLALSGGSLPQLVADGVFEIIKNDVSIPWESFHIFFADERHVPHDHEDSNMKASMDAFISKVPIPQHQIYGIDYEVSVEKAAISYEENMIHVFKKLNLINSETEIPKFDMILLGVGPDGHTCSLFPAHPLLHEDTVLVAPISDSPKPPPKRITLTYKVLNAARVVNFVTAGSGKADILPQVIIDHKTLEKEMDNALPAARVRPDTGFLSWYIDSSAGAKI